MNTRSSTSGLMCCAAAMLTLGASVPLTQRLAHFPAAAGQALRYALAAALLAPLACWAMRGRAALTARQWARLATLAAISLVLFNFCLIAALRHTDSPAVGTVLGCAPLGLALAGPLSRGMRPRARLTTAAAIVVAGTVIVNGAAATSRLGLAFAAGALAADIAFPLLAAPLLRDLTPAVVATATCALSVPMFILTAVASGETAVWRTPSAEETAVLLFLAIALTAAAFLAWFRGLDVLGIERAGMTIGLVPVATLAVAAIQAQSWPGGTQAAGVLLVAVGIPLGITATTDDPADSTKSPSTSEQETRLVAAGDHLPP